MKIIQHKQHRTRRTHKTIAQSTAVCCGWVSGIEGRNDDQYTISIYGEETTYTVALSANEIDRISRIRNVDR